MNGLFSDVTYKDVLIYIGFGGFLGIIYSATASLLRAMTEVFSRDFICRVLSETPGSIVAISNTPNKIKMPLVIKDVFRAFFILIFGIDVLLLNYALTDGTVRVYMIVAAISTCFLTVKLYRRFASRLLVSLLKFALSTVAYILLRPLGIIFRKILPRQIKK